MKPSPDDAPEALRALVGKPVTQIDTPAAVVDLDLMERNLALMASWCRIHDLRWRPHAKMHKCAALAKQQIAAGAVGVCVQKVSEAAALVARGVRDIYISNQVVAPAKLAQVASLARILQGTGGRLAIAVDSADGVSGLARALGSLENAIDVFVEIDVGQGRCGVPPGPAAWDLARLVLAQPAMRFAGLQAYQGQAQHLRAAAERSAAIGRAAEAVRTARAAIEDQGVPVELVTGAGTGSFPLEVATGLWGEIQPGSFLFMDADYARNEPLPGTPRFRQALYIRSQVISRGPGHAVCDAGHKSHAIDSGLPDVLLTPGQSPLRFANGGDEHGVLRCVEPDGQLPAVGDAVWLIPGHCDPTVNLYDWLIGVRGGPNSGVVEKLLRVDTRGCLT